MESLRNGEEVVLDRNRNDRREEGLGETEESKMTIGNPARNVLRGVKWGISRSLEQER